MRLVYAFPADAAQFTEDGKLWILGGDFDAIRVREFPFKQPALALVVKIALLPDECEQDHRIRVLLIGPERQELADVSTTTAPPRRADFPEADAGSPKRPFFVVRGVQTRELARETTDTKYVENRTVEVPAGRQNPLADARFNREDSQAVFAVMHAPPALEHVPEGAPQGDVADLLRRLRSK